MVGSRLKLIVLIFFMQVAHAEYNAPAMKGVRDLSSVSGLRPEADLKSLQEQFYAAARRFTSVPINRIDVRFGHPKEKSEDPLAEGACFSGGSAMPHVEIDRNSWGLYDHWMREQLVFHELGHCVLNRGHDSREITVAGKKMVRSIMHPRMLQENLFLMHRDYYLRELFSGIKETPKLDVRPPVIYYFEIESDDE